MKEIYITFITFCCKSTGDETHYLIECKNEIFAKARLPVITHFLSKYPIFSGLDQKQKAQFLLGCEEPQSLSKVGKFCLLIHETHRNNVELQNISENIKQHNIESYVLKIFESIGIKIQSYDLVAVHRIGKFVHGKHRNVIVRFINS